MTRRAACAALVKHWRPEIGLLMETEVWPLLLAEAEAAGVPMLLVNARLSENSLRQGQRFAALLRPAAQRLKLALAQTEADATRLRAMGVPEVRRRQPQVRHRRGHRAAGARPRLAAALPRPVLMLAVSREGEEAALLVSLGPPARPAPAVADRAAHPQRLTKWPASSRPPASACHAAAAGATHHGRTLTSGWVTRCAKCRSITALPAWPCSAAASSPGWPEPDRGGRLRLPGAGGPHTFNFAETTELALAAGAAERCTAMGETIARGVALCADSDSAASMSKRALAFAAAHRGAARRMVEALPLYGS